MSIFETYGSLAGNKGLTTTEVSGRYRVQAEGLRWAIRDLQIKLALSPGDRFLDIGCGVGDLTIPLGFMVSSTACVDHPEVLKRLRERVPRESFEYFPGSFLETEIPWRFDKILAYGVLICLSSKEEVFAFMDKAIGLLEPGGRFLAGDFVNRDKKQRFLESEAGKIFSKEWSRKMERENVKMVAERGTHAEGVFAQIDDQFILEIMLRYRKQGCEVYLLPQPPELAFGNTREDLLIVKHR